MLLAFDGGCGLANAVNLEGCMECDIDIEWLYILFCWVGGAIDGSACA